MLKRFGGVVVAIIVGLGWFAFDTVRAKAGAPDVGECVVIEGSGDDVDVESADCGSDDVLYKVMADDGKCDRNEANYTVTVKGSEAVDLCLFYDVEVGDCIELGEDKDAKVPCSTKGRTTGRVTKAGDVAAAKCGKRELRIVNKKRDVGFCLGRNA